MRQITLLILLLLPFAIHGQDCDCMSNFKWAKKTFEENDAGFQFALDQKGKSAYEQHNKTFEEKIAKLDNSDDCIQTIFEWMTFFRSGHIAVRRINQEQSQSENEEVEQKVNESFKDWDKIEVDLGTFKKHLNEKVDHGFEGIWKSGSYTIGIKKVGDAYLGFIIEADGSYWTKGQIKLRIEKDLSATYYMQDHSAQNFESATLLGNNYLELGFITLERLFPETMPEPHLQRYFKAISARDPYFEKVNANTALLRIPRFWASEKGKIDSVINANREIILKSKNLIIDLRNNGGGSDASYSVILPFLYTNPIRTVGVEYLSTKLNNQRMLDFIQKEEYGFDEEDKKWAQESYDKLSEQIGEFVMLNEHPITETVLDTIHKYPENIGILIHENNGSTTEQFLLAAKQSKKVKLFGTTTAGVLDISNMYFVKSPCEEFELGYSLTKSMRIPEMTIDDKGIQPDYYIDKEIPKYEWIKHVTEILNE